MSKLTLTGFTLPLFLFLGNSSGNYAAGASPVTRAKAQFEKPLPETKAGPARFKK